jgi:homoserine O-acetyltransferase
VATEIKKMIVKKHFANLGQLTLTSGIILHDLTLAYEVYGELNSSNSNAILISHTLTGDQHAAGRYHKDDPKPGWWDGAIGPGKDLNTDNFCIICINHLAGSDGSSSPKSLNKQTHQPYALSFPLITIADMVNAEKKLMEFLNIPKWHCLIGGCMGGYKTLQWLHCYPENCHHAVMIATHHKVSAHTIASWYVIKQCITADPNWHSGNYYDNPKALNGLAFANMVGSMIWLSRDYFETNFGNQRQQITTDVLAPEFKIEFLLDKIKNKSDSTIDPNCLLYMMKAMTTFDLSAAPNWPHSLNKLKGNMMFISYKNDWRYPVEETDNLVNIFKSADLNCEHHKLDSMIGHGAFIHDYASLSSILRNFINAG